MPNLAMISTPIASSVLSPPLLKQQHANQGYSSNGEAPGMSSSTSQIFATAAAFNISQNVSQLLFFLIHNNFNF